MVLSIATLLLISAPLDGALDRLQQAEGASYLEARQALAQPALREQLTQRVAKARYDHRSWRSDALAEAALIWATQPELAGRALTLRGVDPRFYRTQRKLQPIVGQELIRANVPAPVLVELYTKTFDQYPWTDRAAYPATDSELFRTLRAREQRALREGILSALSEQEHPAAEALLASVATDSKVEWALRATATRGLKTEAPLLLALRDPDHRIASSAVVALGRLPDQTSRLLSLAGQNGLTEAVVRTLGHRGSVAAQKVDATERQQIAQGLLALWTPSLKRPILESLQMIGSPEVVELVRKSNFAAKDEALARMEQAARRR